MPDLVQAIKLLGHIDRLAAQGTLGVRHLSANNVREEAIGP
jgi:hypothetical protein